MKQYSLTSAKRALDESLANNPKEIQRWRNALKKLRPIMPLLRVHRNNPSKSNKERELEKEIEHLKRQINNSTGTIAEMMMAGIIPMHEPPLLPMNIVTQMRYGCDYLSYEWKGKELHLHWIEVNLDRSGRYPTLTPNEQKYKRAVESGNVVNHYHHTWIDGKGKQHWD